LPIAGVPRQQLPAYDPLLPGDPELADFFFSGQRNCGKLLPLLLGLCAAAKMDGFNLRYSFRCRHFLGVAHNLISGISYFAVWMVIWRRSLADMANVSD
jgi:hypothetical protein